MPHIRLWNVFVLCACNRKAAVSDCALYASFYSRRPPSALVTFAAVSPASRRWPCRSIALRCVAFWISEYALVGERDA